MFHFITVKIRVFCGWKSSSTNPTQQEDVFGTSIKEWRLQTAKSNNSVASKVPLPMIMPEYTTQHTFPRSDSSLKHV